MRKLLSIGLTALVAIAALGLAACGSDKADSVRIGTLATEDILPMWVAADEGIFEDAGLDAEVVVFQSATELISAINAGEVDLAMTDPMVTASIYASGTDVQVEWVTLGADASQGRFGIMSADPSVASLTDLAGVPIGVGSNTILEYVMDTLMLEAGVPEEQIVVEELQKLPIRYEAMASGQVKAAALPGSLLALGEAAGFTTIADDTSGANISQSVMIARSEFLRADGGSELVEALSQAWDEAASRINADPSSYTQLLVTNANLSEDVASSYPVNTYPAAALPAQEQIDAVLGWMKHKGYLADDIAYDAATGTFSGR